MIYKNKFHYWTVLEIQKFIHACNDLLLAYKSGNLLTHGSCPLCSIARSIRTRVRTQVNSNACDHKCDYCVWVYFMDVDCTDYSYKVLRDDVPDYRAAKEFKNKWMEIRIEQLPGWIENLRKLKNKKKSKGKKHENTA